jgi:hypothetical protein
MIEKEAVASVGTCTAGLQQINDCGSSTGIYGAVISCYGDRFISEFRNPYLDDR